MKKCYDTILLLTRRDQKHMYRAKEAIELFKTGNIGSIFVTGGYFGLGKKPSGISEAKEIKIYLVENNIPENKIYIDENSLDTMGSFTFPIVEPTENNPSLEDFDNILMLTEENHVKRASNYVKKVIVEDKIDYVSVKGNYSPGLLTAMYNKAFLHALRDIREPDPERVHNFLLKEHPFYQDGWYDKTINQMRKEAILVCLNWLFR